MRENSSSAEMAVLVAAAAVELETKVGVLSTVIVDEEWSCVVLVDSFWRLRLYWRRGNGASLLRIHTGGGGGGRRSSSSVSSRLSASSISSLRLLLLFS